MLVVAAFVCFFTSDDIKARDPAEGSGERAAEVACADRARMARPRSSAEPRVDALRDPQVRYTLYVVF